MTSTPPLSTYELDLLRMLSETDRGLDPCVPVPWAHYEQVMRSLLRKGLVGDYYWSGHGDSLTEAGRALLGVARPPRLPVGCFDGCDRVSR